MKLISFCLSPINRDLKTLYIVLIASQIRGSGFTVAGVAARSDIARPCDLDVPLFLLVLCELQQLGRRHLSVRSIL